MKQNNNPIPPKAKGADLIQAEIIKNLETADVILCDMSCLNPNVFFEFGIRTSLNKPVCIVKDELTESVPFDTTILNHHEYKSSLEHWDIESEINKLSAHLTASLERSKGENTLWKYFGMKSVAEHYKVAEGADSKLEYLTLQMESLGKKVDKITTRSFTVDELFSKEVLRDLDLHAEYEEKYTALKEIKDEIRYLISNDPHRKKQVDILRLDHLFQKKFQHLLSESTLSNTQKEDILEINDVVKQLKKTYFVRKPE